VLLLLLPLQTLVAYVQWVMLIINLPVSWMPWATPSNGSTTAAVSHSFSDFVGWLLGIAFGRSASLDCYLQANDILQADHKRDIISNVFARALGRWGVQPSHQPIRRPAGCAEAWHDEQWPIPA
jgi:hypothetical protein